MEQLSFFDDAWQSPDLPLELLEYRPALFSAAESAQLLSKFVDTVPWHQYTMKMYDKEVVSPRMITWYGDADNPTITAKMPDILPWTEELLMVKGRVEGLAGMRFDSVLLNYYRDGNDSVAWHSDKERLPLIDVVVASVSFGQVRSFDIRHKKDHNRKYSIKLENGSYLLMKAGLQTDWEHRIAKSTRPMKARVNLTFRQIGVSSYKGDIR